MALTEGKTMKKLFKFLCGVTAFCMMAVAILAGGLPFMLLGIFFALFAIC